MSFLRTFKTLLTSKAVAVGAGTALVAGGLAVASPEVFLLEPAADETVESLAEEKEGDAQDEGEPADEDVVEDAVEGVVEGVVEEEEDEPADEDGELVDAEEVLTERVDPQGTDGDGEGRSQTAKDVHKALTATEENPDGLRPGDEGFGQAVAANAQARGGNGKAVSEAARGERGGNDNEAIGSRSSDDGPASKGKDNRPAKAGGPRD